MSSFTLKLIALVTMLADHIHYYLGGILPIPQWFTWLGRISAPLFFFCMSEGMYHTRNRKAYLLRMYLFSVGMGGCNLLLTRLLPHPRMDHIPNNIFATLFLGAAIILCMEELVQNKAAGQTFWMYFVGVELVSVFLTDRLLASGMDGWAQAVQILLPNPMTAEGGIWFVMLGPLFYYFRYDKARMAAAYAAFSAVWLLNSFFALHMGQSVGYAFFSGEYQWMMIAALPFLWCYNGQKGRRSMKYLFYLFYPLHAWGLYLLSRIL
ncbi:MAG: TraX protein [Oscillospiraceae bacterium]|nr:TraX protein [Oscillospiraceae bacterium]